MPAGLSLYKVQGHSMAPTLCPGDYVLTRTPGASTRAPRRGDVVVAAMAGGSRLKRIVGLPEERLIFTEGMLLVDGDRLLEPYLRGLPSYLGVEASGFSLRADEYFLLGDNRAHSTDSRHLGPLNHSAIVGTVVCRVWPLLRRARGPR